MLIMNGFIKDEELSSKDKFIFYKLASENKGDDSVKISFHVSSDRYDAYYDVSCSRTKRLSSELSAFKEEDIRSEMLEFGRKILKEIFGGAKSNENKYVSPQGFLFARREAKIEK